jgi:multiple sugar transport system substrate-binding protein
MCVEPVNPVSEEKSMTIFRRLSCLVLLGAVLSASFIPARAQEPVTLNLWMFLDGTGFLESVVEAFEAEHPNIQINITDVPEDEYTTKIETAILAGQPPDIGFPYSRRWMQAGYFLPLNDDLEGAGINLDDLNQGAISRNCLIDGQLYCLGTYTGGTVLFYNKDLFDAAGIAYPSATEPMTIDEYADIARQLTVTSDNPEEQVWGGAGPQPFWTEVAHYFSEDGRTAIGYINDEATAHFYQVAADLAREGSVLTATEAGLSTADLMATGQVAMAVADTVTMQPLLENIGIRWGAAPPPVESEEAEAWVYTGSDELGVFNGSAHPDEAKLFVTYWGSEGNRLRLEADGLPLNIALAEEGNWAGDSEGRQEMLAAVQTARPTVFVPEWYFVYDHLSEALNGLMIEDGLSAQEALDEIAPIVQDELDEYWETWEQIQPAQ